MIEKELIKQVEDLTHTDYEGNVVSALEDLLFKYNLLQEKMDRFIEDRNENWKQKEFWKEI